MEERRAWLYARILEAGKNGLTSYELVDKINAWSGGVRSGRAITVNVISGRLSELKAEGRIAVSPWQKTRKNAAGNDCDVLVASCLLPKLVYHPKPDPVEDFYDGD